MSEIEIGCVNILELMGLLFVTGMSIWGAMAL